MHAKQYSVNPTYCTEYHACLVLLYCSVEEKKRRHTFPARERGRRRAISLFHFPAFFFYFKRFFFFFFFL